MNNIYVRLWLGGGFLFFEKVRAPDARFQDMTNQIYTETKLIIIFLFYTYNKQI